MLNKGEKFIKKGLLLFGDNYSYEFVDYKSSKDKVIIKCNKHDNLFEQVPSEHLRGKKGCKLCSNKRTLTKVEYLTEINKKHKDRYTYPDLKYKNLSSTINIKCPKHGLFTQNARKHLKGDGCQKCHLESINKKKETKDFIKECNNVHGGLYNYDKCVYVKSKDKVIIGCDIHGYFEQVASKHLMGQGCPKCANLKRSVKNIDTEDDFKSKSKLYHGDLYGYDHVEYKNSHTHVDIKCSKHGIFKQLPYDHISGHGCPKCYKKSSNEEKEINDFINELGLPSITSDREFIKPKEIDILINSEKLAIEYNGLFWHSSLFKSNNYHINKTIECEKKGFRLIHIFEDEWINKKEIVKSRLRNILNKTKNKVYGRKCVVKKIDTKDKTDFLNKNHLQGTVSCSIKLGLYYDGELVSVMTFSKSRPGIGSKHDGYELSRFANKINTNVIGGASKLMSFFIKNYEPKSIISYADRRWSDGGLYKTLGFEEINTNKPNYWYVINKERKHRFGYRKSRLSKSGFDVENKTERESMESRNIHRVYDCGTITYKKTLTI